MTTHTITLFQYNQKQAPKNKATEKDVALDLNDCYTITRVVLGKGGEQTLTNFNVPRCLTPGLGSRLVDMMKFNIEFDNGHHHDAGPKFAQDDFVRGVWSHVRVAPTKVDANA
jgi:hypothetical protein